MLNSEGVQKGNFPRNIPGKIPVPYWGKSRCSMTMPQRILSMQKIETETFTEKGVSMAMVIDVLRASRELYYFSKILFLTNDVERKSMANLLTRLGTSIKSLFEELTDGQVSSGTTVKLEQLSYELHHRLEPLMGRNRAQALADKFNQIHRLKLLQDELEAGLLDARELVLLDEAANHLLEIANRLNQQL